MTWTRCSDVLPPVDVIVICAFKSPSGSITVRPMRLDSGKYLLRPKARWQETNGAGAYSLPVAWHPLPPPPPPELFT